MTPVRTSRTLETDHRLRAARRRPDGLARHARARRVRQVLHGLRAPRGLRPPVPLRRTSSSSTRTSPRTSSSATRSRSRRAVPTIAHHRHPFDSVRMPRNSKTGDIRTIARRAHPHRRRAADDELLHEPGQHGARGPRAATSTRRSAWWRKQHVTHYGSLHRPVYELAARCCCRREYHGDATCTTRSTRPRSTPRVKKMWEHALRAGSACTWHMACRSAAEVRGHRMAVRSFPPASSPSFWTSTPRRTTSARFWPSRSTLTAQDEEFVEHRRACPSDFRFFTLERHR